MRAIAAMGLAAVLALGPSAWASAQDEDKEEAEEEFTESSEDEEETSEGEGDEEGEDDESADEEGEPAEGDEAAAVPAERSWYFGPYFRYVFVPAFMLELFLDESPSVGNAAFGVVANYRSGEGKPTFQIGIGYTGYGFEDPFRAKGDPVEDTEWVESDLGLLQVTGSILWNAEIVEKKLTFEYGVGIDLGIVLGELKRTEAYIESATGAWRKCGGPANPPVAIAFCEPGSVPYDEEGAHYNVTEERVPPIAAAPMVPHLALRYDPIPEVAIKLEFAYGILQMWFGLSAYYAPEI